MTSLPLLPTGSQARTDCLKPAVDIGRERRAAGRHLDAVLLRACSVFDDLERQQQRVGTVRLSPSAEALETVKAERRSQRQLGLLRTILTRQASTLEGVRAKAATLYLWDGDLGRTDETFWNVMLVRSIVSDLLRLPETSGRSLRSWRAPDASPPSPG